MPYDFNNIYVRMIKSDYFLRTANWLVLKIRRQCVSCELGIFLDP
jgi:hypothetical protein